MGKAFDETGLARLVTKIKGADSIITDDANNGMIEVAAKLNEENMVLNAMAVGGGATVATDWKAIQALVRSGLADKFYSVGDQLICKRNGVDIAWDILAFDHDVPIDTGMTHSMTLQMHHFIPSIQFDSREAFYVASSAALPAGTYNFVYASHPWYAADSGVHYQFTLTQQLPKGGQLVFNQSYNVTFSGGTISAYSSSTATTATETATMAQGATGTELTTLNNIQRALLGYNNYEKSAMRQWLNSSAASGWWSAKNEYDRPSSNNGSAGFLNGLDADFLEVIGKVSKKTRLNTVTDGGGTKTSQEKFFLPSRVEVFMETSADEGTVYDYYKKFSDLASAGTGADTNRIKYNLNAQTTASYWWLRSPYTGSAYTEYTVSPTGAIGNSLAISSLGASPACNIV